MAFTCLPVLPPTLMDPTSQPPSTKLRTCGRRRRFRSDMLISGLPVQDCITPRPSSHPLAPLQSYSIQMRTCGGAAALGGHAGLGAAVLVYRLPCYPELPPTPLHPVLQPHSITSRTCGRRRHLRPDVRVSALQRSSLAFPFPPNHLLLSKEPVAVYWQQVYATQLLSHFKASVGADPHTCCSCLSRVHGLPQAFHKRQLSLAQFAPRCF